MMGDLAEEGAQKGTEDERRLWQMKRADQRP